MVKTKKPNTICRNPNCHKGENGEPKHFYACLSCLRGQKWQSYCCCVECYDEYTKIILESRAKAAKENKKPADDAKSEVLPIRTDMTENEIKNVMNTPQRGITTYTREVELKDYFNENPVGTISDAVEQINKDIDRKEKRKKKNDFFKE